jgi:cell division protein FtsN
MAAARKKPAPKRGASRPQAPAQKPVPGWVWLACGLVIGGFVMFLMSLEPGKDSIKRPVEQAHKNAKPAKEQQPAKPKYDFYTLLPESEVIVPPESLPRTPPAPAPKPAAKPVTPQEAAKIDTERALAALSGKIPPPPPPVAAAVPATHQFFLQAGSFQTRAQAESIRAQVTLIGQVARLESGTVGDRTWHRVLVGPFNSREQMNSAQKQLSSNGFSNLLPQQRKVQ